MIFGKMEFSPRLVIQRIEGYNIVRDDILTGGTKQRLLNHLDFFKEKIRNCGTLLYTGNYGYGLIFTAILANELDKKCICAVNMFYMNGEKFNDINIIKKKIPENTVVEKFNNWKELVKYGIEKEKDKDIFWMPLGIDFDGVSTLLSQEISRNINDGFFHQKKIWVVCGVGLLTESLARAFPSSIINSIVITKSLKKRNDITKRLRYFKNILLIFVDNLPTCLNVPYPTTKGYDDITWYFANKYGKEGDYIWNTAS